MNYWIIGLLFFITIFLQASVTTIPLTLILLVLLYCLYRSDWIFLAAFISGVFLDFILVHSIGVTSIFFVLLLFLIFLYQRKFEIASYYFVCLSLFLGSGLYTFLFGFSNIFLIGLVSAIIGLIIYILLLSYIKPQKKTLLNF